ANLKSAVLFGDPSKSGVYVVRIKFAPGAKVMPHWHPDEVRTATVLSGTYYFAVGEQWAERVPIARARLRASGLSRHASRNKIFVWLSRSITRCTRSTLTASKSSAEGVSSFASTGKR